MNEFASKELSKLLRTKELRFRTGILLLTRAWFSREAEVSAYLDVEHVDLTKWKLNRVPLDRRYLDIRWETLVEDLSTIVNDNKVYGQCILISNVDLFVAALPFEDRLRFWDFMRTTFRRPRGLILSFPAESPHLLQDDERQKWEISGRIASWRGGALDVNTTY
jgi:hypothetical protein